MRNLAEGNKVNFTIFTVIVVIILVILVSAVLIVMNSDKEEYTVSSNACIYDKEYSYIELENDAVISKKWTGNYYLKEDITGSEYELGDYAIAYDKNKSTLDLFGTFYQVLEGGDISKLTGYNTVSGTNESKFYKIDDRKYLIVANSIVNDTGLISTSDYLIVIVDRLGNALLLNDEINAKTINEMVLSTDDFSFDVANEILTFNDETIELSKIIGSTNEYVQTTNDDDDDDDSDEEDSTGASSVINSSTTTTTENNSTTVVSGGSSTTTDTSWVDKLNNWISEVAAGFLSIYNGNSGSSEDNSSLSKSITLNSLSAGTTYIDINYTITDPENVYNVVYATVSDGTHTYSFSLDKSATTYRVTGLSPNTNYSVDIGYKIVYSSSETEENVEDTMTVRTTSPTESLEITKVSLTKIYYKLTLDSGFTYDTGVTVGIYLNDSSDPYDTITLSDSVIEKAASSGYTGSFTIPDSYKATKNTTLTIKLENTLYNGTEIDTGLMAKIANY